VNSWVFAAAHNRGDWRELWAEDRPPPHRSATFRALDGWPRLEAVFDPGQPVDDRARQMLAAGAHVAGLLLEIERANGRWPLASARSSSDGAALLIGSSRAIRLVRDERELRN
jgi:hypothetical protein